MVDFIFIIAQFKLWNLSENFLGLNLNIPVPQKREYVTLIKSDNLYIFSFFLKLKLFILMRAFELILQIVCGFQKIYK